MHLLFQQKIQVIYFNEIFVLSQTFLLSCNFNSPATQLMLRVIFGLAKNKIQLREATFPGGASKSLHLAKDRVLVTRSPGKNRVKRVSKF